jgi:hypothetical protein
LVGVLGLSLGRVQWRAVGKDFGEGFCSNSIMISIKENVLLNQKERKQLISFLKALTDTSYLKNQFYTDPFAKN